MTILSKLGHVYAPEERYQVPGSCLCPRKCAPGNIKRDAARSTTATVRYQVCLGVAYGIYSRGVDSNAGGHGFSPDVQTGTYPP